MVDDIVPKLLKVIQTEFKERYNNHPEIKAILKIKIENLSYVDANRYSVLVGELLSQVLESNINSQILPDGRMYFNIADRILKSTLGNNYQLIADYSGKVQKSLNRQANFSSIKVVKPEFPDTAIIDFVNKISAKENFEEVRFMLGEPVVSFGQNIVADSIKKNAALQAIVGLSPQIIRTLHGKGCDFCRTRAGKYDYGKEPEGFYRRHGNCRCTIEYFPGDGRRQNAWSKKYTKLAKNEHEHLKQINLDIRDNNRQRDIVEYKEIVAILGVEKAPISLAKFQDLKYNNGEEYERLVDKTFIQNKFNTGAWLDKVNPEKQARHFKSSVVEGKSYFYDDVDVNVLYDRFKQTSRFRRTRKGRNEENYEMIDLPADLKLGKDVYTGEYINGFTIHYGKTGSHLIPTYHRKENSDET